MNPSRSLAADQDPSCMQKSCFFLFCGRLLSEPHNNTVNLSIHDIDSAAAAFSLSVLTLRCMQQHHRPITYELLSVTKQQVDYIHVKYRQDHCVYYCDVVIHRIWRSSLAAFACHRKQRYARSSLTSIPVIAFPHLYDILVCLSYDYCINSLSSSITSNLSVWFGLLPIDIERTVRQCPKFISRHCAIHIR